MSVATITRAQYRRLAPEHDLQVAVLNLLELKATNDFFWFSIPNAGKRTPRQGRRMRLEGMKAGVADLCIMGREGAVYWLELKTAKGRQSPAQRGFQEVCLLLGHPYAMARSLKQAEIYLRGWMILK